MMQQPEQNRPSFNNQAAVSPAGTADPIETSTRFVRQALRDLGFRDAAKVRVNIADGEQFASQTEHFTLRSDGNALLRDSFFEKVKDNEVLLCTILAHEIYHNLRQGLSSYKQAMHLIRAFSSSDIIRADLETDRSVYRAITRYFDVGFEDYCRSVMLVYPNLFGAANKDFGDFSRFCSKLFTLESRVGRAVAPEGVIMLSPHKSGWTTEGENTLVTCQIVTDRTSFGVVVIPTRLVAGLERIFGMGSHQETLESMGGGARRMQTEVDVGIMAETVRASVLLRGLDNEN